MKPKIVFLINSSFPYYSGGRETWLYNISKKLISMGFHIDIIVQKNYGRSLQFTNVSSLIEITPCSTLLNIPFFRPIVRSYFRVLDSLILSIQMARKIKEKYSNDYRNCVFISMDSIYTALSVGLLKIRNKDVKYICSDRGRHAVVLSEHFPLISIFFYIIEKWAYMSADEIWANGNDTKAYIKNRGFRSVLVKNGVNIENIDRDNSIPNEELFKLDNFIITNVATLLDIKGILEFIEAGAILRNWGVDNFKLVFVGKGNQEKYKNYAKKLKVLDKVHFLGEKKNVIPYLKGSDVIVCLSGGGGMSMSALEALASRTPVIAWNSAIYTQLIEDGVNGFLVEEKNSTELAKSLKLSMINRSKYKAVGDIARKRIEPYCWNNIAQHVSLHIKNIYSKNN